MSFKILLWIWAAIYWPRWALCDEGAQKSLRNITHNLLWNSAEMASVNLDCVRRCAEHWLPDFLADQPLLGDEPAMEWPYICSTRSELLCKVLEKTRAMQRCYVSSCGDINARIPTLKGTGPVPDCANIIWPLTALQIGIWDSDDYLHNVFEPPADIHLGWAWEPVPLGLIAACELSPEGAFDYTRLHKSLVNLRRRTALDDRFRTVPSIRKLLLPIWRSKNILEDWGYDVKPSNPGGQISADITTPRSLTDLYKHVVSSYVFATTAYAHLLSLTSNSHFYLAEAIQLLMFIFIPTLPTVQILRHLSSVVEHVLLGGPFEFKYLVAAGCGVSIYEPSTAILRELHERIIDVEVAEVSLTSLGPRDPKWLLRLTAIGFNLGILCFTIIPYFKRVNSTFLNSTYCAATGLDHRSGLVALSALLPIIMSLVFHIMNNKCALRTPGTRFNTTHDWRIRLAFDTVLAIAVLEVIIVFMGRITPTALLERHSKDMLIKDLFILIVFLGFLGYFWTVLGIVFSRPTIKTTARWLLLALILGYAIIVFLIHIFVDMEEYADLALNFVLPWNFRWQEPGPKWPSWWGL